MKNNGILTLNKWHFKFGLIYFYAYRGLMFYFGIFKLTSFPKEGEMITKKNYKGFWIRKHFRGFEIEF